jgi:hypothetical protein
LEHSGYLNFGNIWYFSDWNFDKLDVVGIRLLTRDCKAILRVHMPLRFCSEFFTLIICPCFVFKFSLGNPLFSELQKRFLKIIFFQILPLHC